MLMLINVNKPRSVATPQSIQGSKYDSVPFKPPSFSTCMHVFGNVQAHARSGNPDCCVPTVQTIT